jgi:outer membrane protein assembly factor BamC
MKIIVATLLAFFVIGLAACGGPSADLEYLDSRVLPDLEVPPDLTLVNVDSGFKLPEIFSGDDTEARNSVPVLANVDSIKLEGQSDFYWLSINQPVDNLYQLAKDFWASEGFTLIMDEPVIGIMKTDWVYSEEGKGVEDKGFFARLFAANDRAASQDQYKTRIARGTGTSDNQIYISHRGTEYRLVSLSGQEQKYAQANLIKLDDEDEWNFRASEPELEVEMLSRLMLYLGLRQSEVDSQLANIKIFSPRASIHTDFSGDETGGETYLLVKDEYSRTWYRVLHQLERLNLDIISADFSSGLSNKAVVQVETDIDIEVKASGFFSFSSEMKTVKKRLKLILSKETYNITRIDMETDRGDIDNSPEGAEFLALLYQHIK